MPSSAFSRFENPTQLIFLMQVRVHPSAFDRRQDTLRIGLLCKYMIQEKGKKEDNGHTKNRHLSK